MPGRFDNSIVYQIQQANDIVELISEHVNLARKGREMVGLCPFHEDHRPSLCVNESKQIFKCFACGAGGDVFKFVQMSENLSFPQAIERLAQRAGIRLPESRRAKDSNSGNDIDPNKLAKVNGWAVKHFQHNLFNTQRGKETLKYLAQRQIPLQSIKKWQLGLALESGDNLIRAGKTKKDLPLLLRQAGLVVNQNGRLTDKFINRLIFTITDVTGRVIGFGARTLDGTGAKYINSPGTVLFDKSNSLYGLQQARAAIISKRTAVVVEGYTDCIMAHAKGHENVVATLGTSFTTGHARILRRYTKNIVLLFDGDTAGVEAANRALEVCVSQHIDIKLGLVPDGKDPCELLLSGVENGFEELINNAVEVFEYKWNRLKEQFDHDNSLTGRKRAVDEFLQTLASTIKSSSQTVTDRGLVINRLSNLLGLSTRRISAELYKRLKRAQGISSYHSENQKACKPDIGSGLLAAAQREILEVLLNAPSLFANVKQEITADAFDVPVLHQIAHLVFKVLSKNPDATVQQIMVQNESLDISSCLAEFAQRGEEKGNFELRLREALEVIQHRRKISEIKSFTENTAKRNPHSIGLS